MAKILFITAVLLCVFGATPTTHAQAAYYDAGQNGFTVGFNYMKMEGHSSGGGTIGFVGRGFVEGSLSLQADGTVHTYSLSLAGYPLKQGWKRMPFSLGFGGGIGWTVYQGIAHSAATGAIIETLRLDAGPNVFFVQSASLNYLTGIDELDGTTSGSVGLELVFAPKRVAFIGIGVQETFTEYADIHGFTLTLSFLLDKHPGESVPVDW